MAEIHIIGQLVSGHGIHLPYAVPVFCTLTVTGIDDESWIPLNRASTEGTSASISCLAGDGTYIWQQPVDLHYAFSSMVKWPRLAVDLMSIHPVTSESFIIARGSVSLPVSAGYRELSCQLARRNLTRHDQLRFNVLGEMSTSGDECYSEAFGYVKLALNIVHRRFEENGLLT